MSETNPMSIPVELPPGVEALTLPEPDTHCWDDDTQKDVWSYSKDLVREHEAKAARTGYLAGLEAAAKVCDDQTQDYEPYTGNPKNLAYQCAAAIRQLKEDLCQQ